VCDEWSLAPTSTGYSWAHAAIFVENAAMASLCVNLYLAPTYKRRARGWVSRNHCFPSLRYNPTGHRTPSLSTLVARAQITLLPNAIGKFWCASSRKHNTTQCIAFPIHHRRARCVTDGKCDFSSLQNDLTGNRTHCTSFVGACSTHIGNHWLRCKIFYFLMCVLITVENWISMLRKSKFRANDEKFYSNEAKGEVQRF